MLCENEMNKNYVTELDFSIFSKEPITKEESKELVNMLDDLIRTYFNYHYDGERFDNVSAINVHASCTEMVEHDA